MKTTLSIFFILLTIVAKPQSISVDSIITLESLKYTVSALAHDSMKGRFTALPQTKKTAEFIAARFKEAGLKPLAGNDEFFGYYPLKFLEKDSITLVQAINVMGAVKGNINSDTVIIFCAHYDHIGVKDPVLLNEKDSIYNGANDNASGVALLIELAKYYTALKMNRHTLLFIAFSGEEQGLLGSAYTASHMDQSLINAVINFDMVGRPINSYTKKCMVIAEKTGRLIKNLNAHFFPKEGFFMEDMFPMENLFMRSDHYSFNKVEKRIFFTTSSSSDKFYHTLRDELKTIDLDFLLTTTKNIATGCKIFLK